MQPPAPGEPKPDTPAYKHWWFWMVGGVGAIILVDSATSDSESDSTQPLTRGQWGVTI